MRFVCFVTVKPELMGSLVRFALSRVIEKESLLGKALTQISDSNLMNSLSASKMLLRRYHYIPALSSVYYRII